MSPFAAMFFLDSTAFSLSANGIFRTFLFTWASGFPLSPNLFSHRKFQDKELFISELFSGRVKRHFNK